MYNWMEYQKQNSIYGVRDHLTLLQPKISTLSVLCMFSLWFHVYICMYSWRCTGMHTHVEAGGQLQVSFSLST